MSGGSYDYLYAKPPGDLHEYIPELERLADRLRDMEEYAAAEEVDAHATRIVEYHNQMKATHDRLSDVMKAVEWYDSGDWGRNSVHEACEDL